MSRSYSVAEARDQLSRLVHEAEDAPVELTRRGVPVAVLLSVDAYRALLADRGSFWVQFDRFREEHGVTDLDIEPERWLGGVRASSPARDVGGFE